MLTYRGGGGDTRRPSSWPLRSSWLDRWRTVHWSPLVKNAAFRCVYTLLCIPLSVVGLLAVRLAHGAIVRTCVALLSLIPKGYPDLLYRGDSVVSPPKSKVYLVEMDLTGGMNASHILEHVICQDPRFRMRLVYSRFGSNVWKNCDGSWNIRDHVREELKPSVSLADYMDGVLSEPFLDGFPPWKARVIKSRVGQVLILYVHRTLVSALERLEKSGQDQPFREVAEDPTLWLTRKLERWCRLWLSCPSVVLHRACSQLRVDVPDDRFALASTGTIPNKFLETLASRSERPAQDVLLSCIAGALRRTFHYLRGSCPVDIITAVVKSGSEYRTVSMPLCNYDPLTRLKRMATARTDPLDWKPGVVLSEDHELTWWSPRGRPHRVLHVWSLDASGVHVNITMTKEGTHLDVSCRKDFLERPDVLASAIEREVQDLAITVGLHRPGSPLPLSVGPRALGPQVTEKDFWSMQFERVCELHRLFASLLLFTR